MTRYGHRTALLVAMLGYLLLVPLAAWAQQPKPGGTLRVAWEADVTGLDPHLSTGIQSWHVVGNLLRQLKNSRPQASGHLEQGGMSAWTEIRHHSNSHQKPDPFLRRSHDEPNHTSVVPGAHRPL